MHIIKRAAAALAAAAVFALVVLLFINHYPVSALNEGNTGNSAGKRVDPVRNSANLLELADQLDQEIRAGAMEVSLSLYDISSAAEINLNGLEPIYPASMIKTLLLLAALKQVEEGRVSLSDGHTLSDEDRYAGGTPVTGSGVLQFAENGSTYTFEELLSLMVSASDNIATNIVYDRVGPAAVEKMAKTLGLKQTAFTRKMYEMDSPLPSNVSTARELTEMLTALEKGTLTGSGLRELGIRMMTETEDKQRIGRYLDGEGVLVANKVGTVTGVIGDMALIYFPHRPPVALTVAVKNPAEQEEAARLIGRLARLVVNHFG